MAGVNQDSTLKIKQYKFSNKATAQTNVTRKYLLLDLDLEE